MNKIFTLLFSLLTFVVFAQDVVTPASSEWAPEFFNQLDTYVAGTFDHSELYDEDARIEEETGRYNYGRIAFETIDLIQDGDLTTLPNGDHIWRLKFKSAGALAVSVLFEDFHLPSGSSLYLYSADYESSLYPMNSKDNTSHGKFVTDYIMTDEAIIEYYQPADVVGSPVLDIRGFAHHYRSVFDPYDSFEDTRGSDPCEINVNCPEGDGWEAQRDATIRMQITDGGFVFLCSGSMVNTTALDCRQYMLTALHCMDGVSDSDLLSMQVKYNYERPNCDGGSFSTGHNRVGVERLADSNDGGGASGSDFALCLVIDDIPENYNAFYLGWDATGAGSSEGVSIHHPSGDIKKISTYTSNLQSTSWGAFGTHWRVVWAETVTDHGVTEGGSSGSPLFNESKLLVGTLTGGGSFCTLPNAPDAYGKMDEHWDQNPNSSTQKLKVWLDPENTGEQIMFGAYAPDCSTPHVGVDEIEFSDIEIFPNPVGNVLQISINKNQIEVERIDIYNAMGVLVSSEMNAQNIKELDLSHLSDGAYFITFTTANGQQLTKKFAKM